MDETVSAGQGLRIIFESGARIIFRLSGTGTAGATLRLYVESYEPDASRQQREVQEALAPYIAAAAQLAELKQRTGRDAPTVIT